MVWSPCLLFLLVLSYSLFPYVIPFSVPCELFIFLRTLSEGVKTWVKLVFFQKWFIFAYASFPGKLNSVLDVFHNAHHIWIDLTLKWGDLGSDHQHHCPSIVPVSIKDHAFASSFWNTGSISSYAFILRLLLVFFCNASLYASLLVRLLRNSNVLSVTPILQAFFGHHDEGSRSLESGWNPENENQF